MGNEEREIYMRDYEGVTWGGRGGFCSEKVEGRGRKEEV
jgi:hypothetical protein